MDMKELADLVVMTVQNALAPRDQRIAVLEEKVKHFQETLMLEKRCASLETRCLELEAKAAARTEPYVER